jgi:hypothetical protein
MTITKRIQNTFPGITALITGFVRAFRAGRAYDLEMRGIKTLCSEVPINKWMLKISKHSPLSYYDAYRIVTFLTEESKAFKRNPDKVTKYIIGRACMGYTADVILVVLSRIDDRTMLE